MLAIRDVNGVVVLLWPLRDDPASCLVCLQVLPFCSDETLDQLEKNLVGLPSMTEMLNNGDSPQDITDRILKDIGQVQKQGSIQPR
jgi:redox-regulated HSP33 family molecular chaperone